MISSCILIGIILHDGMELVRIYSAFCRFRFRLQGIVLCFRSFVKESCIQSLQSFHSLLFWGGEPALRGVDGSAADVFFLQKLNETAGEQFYL